MNEQQKRFADEYRAAMRAHRSTTAARVYAIDEIESTIYVLVENGVVVASAHWPHPLYELCPSATYGGTLGGETENCRLLPPPLPDLTEDLLAVVDEWVREPRFSPLP